MHIPKRAEHFSKYWKRNLNHWQLIGRWCGFGVSNNDVILTVIYEAFNFMSHSISLLHPPSIEECCLYVGELPAGVGFQSHYYTVQNILHLCNIEITAIIIWIFTKTLWVYTMMNHLKIVLGEKSLWTVHRAAGITQYVWIWTKTLFRRKILLHCKKSCMQLTSGLRYTGSQTIFVCLWVKLLRSQ